MQYLKKMEGGDVQVVSGNVLETEPPQLAAKNESYLVNNKYVWVYRERALIASARAKAIVSLASLSYQTQSGPLYTHIHVRNNPQRQFKMFLSR